MKPRPFARFRNNRHLRRHLDEVQLAYNAISSQHLSAELKLDLVTADRDRAVRLLQQAREDLARANAEVDRLRAEQAGGAS